MSCPSMCDGITGVLLEVSHLGRELLPDRAVPPTGAQLPCLRGEHKAQRTTSKPQFDEHHALGSWSLRQKLWTCDGAIALHATHA